MFQYFTPTASTCRAVWIRILNSRAAQMGRFTCVYEGSDVRVAIPDGSSVKNLSRLKSEYR